MDRRRSSRRQSRRFRRPWLKKCKEYIRTFIAFMFSNVGIIGLVIGYTIAGSFIFQYLESGKVIEVQVHAKGNRTYFAERLWNLTMDLNTDVKLLEKDYRTAVNVELVQFQKIFVNLTRKGYDGSDDVLGVKSWSFAGAFLFSLTVITTIDIVPPSLNSQAHFNDECDLSKIQNVDERNLECEKPITAEIGQGYGNIWTRTRNAKIASIVYAIIGMPLFLLYLSNIGDVMARSFKWIYANFCLCRWCPGVAKRRAERRIERDQQMFSDDDTENGSKNSSSTSGSPEVNIEMTDMGPRGSITSEGLTNYTEESYDVQNVTVPITVCLMIMVGYICGGAILFFNWEYESGWTFLDASYFCFISLSTIGFGDFVPGDKIYGQEKIEEILELKFVFCSLYLMLGMALIAMCFNLMQWCVTNRQLHQELGVSTASEFIKKLTVTYQLKLEQYQCT